MCFCRTHSYFSYKDLCHEYKVSWLHGIIFNNVVTGLIAAFNFGIRTINIELVRYIGFKTYSKQTRSVMMTIAVA